LLGDLELHGPLGFLLHDDRTGSNATALDHIMDPQPDQIAPTQFAVDCEIK
jgi:hypothetical protein